MNCTTVNMIRCVLTEIWNLLQGQSLNFELCKCWYLTQFTNNRLCHYILVEVRQLSGCWRLYGRINKTHFKNQTPGSAGFSVLFDIIINLAHSLFYNPTKDGSKNLYQVRTRKILLISNLISSSSSTIAACITENPKQLDIGEILVTVGHLFTDLRFITNLKKEFIETEMQKRLQAELDEVDILYNNMV